MAYGTTGDPHEDALVADTGRITINGMKMQISDDSFAYGRDGRAYVNAYFFEPKEKVSDGLHSQTGIIIETNAGNKRRFAQIPTSILRQAIIEKNSAEQRTVKLIGKLVSTGAAIENAPKPEP